MAKHWNLSAKTKRKISLAKFGNKNGSGNKGKKLSKETKKR